jgi:rhodanese-related sulfurtransferase
MVKFFVSIVLMIFVFSGSLFAYDVELAKKFDTLFSQLNPQVLTMRPCQVTTKDMIDMIKKNEDFVILDIRTPAEQKIIAPVWKGSLLIPMHELFKPENLAKLPKDKKILVLCHTGDRAAAATIALRAIGFSNAFQFKGGMAELAKEIGRTATEYVKD